MPKRKARPRELADFGPGERIVRREVIITGDGQHRRARAVDVVMRMDKPQRDAAEWLLSLWEAAEYRGWACTNLLRSNGGYRGIMCPSERAMGARRTLSSVAEALVPWKWSVIFHVLLMGETQAAYAIRARIRRQDVTPWLRIALAAVAEVQRCLAR